VKPWRTLADAPGFDGRRLTLQERDGTFVIRTGGQVLMSSERHHSEEAMASLALGEVTAPRPAVLIGGLGMGYTLRAVLDLLPPLGEVVVAEISSDVVEWNRGPLAHLARSPLSDPRVKAEVGDVGRLVASSGSRFDAVLLDIDNGPSALTLRRNQERYEPKGLHALYASLKPGGTLVVWSAGPDARFLERLRKAKFEAQVHHGAARAGSRATHVLFTARRPA
jgi:spermidine synthase